MPDQCVSVNSDSLSFAECDQFVRHFKIEPVPGRMDNFCLHNVLGGSRAELLLDELVFNSVFFGDLCSIHGDTDQEVVLKLFFQ